MKTIISGWLLLAAVQGQAQRPQPVSTPKDLLQGIWAEQEDENAVFWVRGNRLTYVDFLGQPRRYTLTPTTLTIYQVDGPYPCRLRKLTPDSLVLVNPHGMVERYYKRQ